MFGKNKKGQFSMFQGAALSLVVIGITLAVGLAILTGVQGTLTTGSYAANAAQNATIAVNGLVTWLPTIVTVVAAVVVLGFVFLIGRQKQA
jgi:hypothetical protein